MNSCSHWAQDGALAQSLKHAAAKGKEAVKIKDALSTLASSSKENIEDIAKQLADGNDIKTMETNDVTAEYLEPRKVAGPHALSCNYFVYRGTVQALAGQKVQAGQKQFGIMAGCSDCVLDVCLAADVESALLSQELIDRWNKCEYTLMGLVAWDHDQDSNPRNHTESMALLMSKQAESKPLLLLIFGPDCQPQCWEFNGEYSSGDFVQVELNNKRKNRRKDTDFKIFSIDQVGVTFEDQAKHLVYKAVCQQLDRGLTQSQSKTGKENKIYFQKVAAPPDGYCFWHSVLAALNPQKFCAVKRYMNGFAVNSRQEKSEAKAAQMLCKTAAGSHNADMLFENGYVEPQQISGIGDKLNLAIRCTIAEEA